MARQPAPGQVKTRLAASGLPGRAVAEIAAAMLRCTVERTALFGRTVLAVTPDNAGEALRASLDLGDVRVVDQGPGDLGERLDRVWRIVGERAPLAFFGMDSPDVPDSLLRAIPVALEAHDVAIGPTGDGGYWTLAARGYAGQVLRQIDWGSESVYDQTCRQAGEAGLQRASLPVWDDVDDAADLMALRDRLGRLKDRRRDPEKDAAPLIELARRLDELLGQRTISDTAS